MTTARGHFAPGAEFVGGSRTVTDAEISFLPALMGAISPLFHDDVTARASTVGGRVLYGPALLGICIALTESLLGDRVRGLVGIDSVRFRRPVFVGDTVTARFTVGDCTAREGKPGMLLTVDDEARNQDDEVVLRFARTVLIAQND
jgi:acyl dehydratase